MFLKLKKKKEKSPLKNNKNKKNNLLQNIIDRILFENI